MSKFLGKRINQLRKEKGFSLDHLAEITQTAKSYLWTLENKEDQNPSSDKVIKLAEALGVTADYLLATTEVPDKNIIKDAFYRKFSELPDEDQKKIEAIIDAWRKMGEKPVGYRLNRIDKDGDFEPDNCEWVPFKRKSK